MKGLPLEESDNRTMLKRLGRSFVVLLLLWSIAALVFPRLRTADPSGVLLELQIDFDDPRREPESVAHGRLAGDLQVPILLQDAAACRNGPDWLRDHTLNTTVVVASSPQLVRVAELLASGDYEAEMVESVEAMLWRGVAEPQVLSTVDFGQAAEYLDARSVAPDDSAVERFVAYASTRNLFGRGYLMLLDTQAIDRQGVEAFARQRVDARIYVAGSQAEPRSIRASQCRDTLRKLVEGPAG